MPQLTIHFRGLCLFAPSKDGTRIHVLLAQPRAHHHRLVRQYHDGSDWITEEMPRGWDKSYGIPGAITVGMPANDEMSNLSTTTVCKGTLREDQAVAEPNGPKGSHILLNGGTVRAIGEIGIWRVDDGSSTDEYYFPYIVEWTGPAATDDPTGLVKFWNASPNETPNPGKNSKDPRPQSAQQSSEEAAMHMGVWFEILNCFGAPMRMTSVKTATAGFGRRSTPSTTVKEGEANQESIIVASCPSARISLS